MSVVVVGAGGHAAVVLEILLANRVDVFGLTDAAHDKRRPRELFGVPIVGTDDVLPALHREGVDGAIVAIGDNALRRRLAGLAVDAGLRLVNAVHPQASVSPSAKIGDGVAIMAMAVINARASIGDGVIVNTGASVDHDCRIGPYAHVAPGSRLGGGVHCGEESLIGIGASVIPHVTVGDRASIGAGAAVVHDVRTGATVVGVPARPRT